LDGNKDGRPHAEHWMRFADGRDADSVSLVSMVDFAPPAVLEIGEFSTITVELSVHVRARPAPGCLACRVFTKHVSGDLHEEGMEIWDSRGKVVAQGRQLAKLLRAVGGVGHGPGDHLPGLLLVCGVHTPARECVVNRWS